MKKFAKKSIESHGKTVEVETAEVPNPEGPPVIEVTAVTGQQTVVMRRTLGAVDGAQIPFTAEQMQVSIDDLREKAARKAAYLETLRESLQEIE